MDGRAQLLTLAHAITGASEVEAAWAGTGPMVDIRKTCGLCGEDQPVRIPFLRHVCRGCAGTWVPGICVECAHTSTTFTVDGQLSPSATCGCGGRLRQLALVPKPRVAVDPVVAAEREIVITRRKQQARHTTRWLLVGIAVFATLGALRITHHEAPPRPARVALPPRPEASMTPEQQGRLAGERLVGKGRINDVFACAALVPPAASAPSTAGLPTASATPASASLTPAEQESRSVWSKAFVAACLSG